MNECVSGNSVILRELQGEDQPQDQAQEEGTSLHQCGLCPDYRTALSVDVSALCVAEELTPPLSFSCCRDLTPLSPEFLNQLGQSSTMIQTSAISLC